MDWILKGASLDRILDSGYLPQSIIRIGIRRQLAERLRDIASTSLSSAYETKMKYINALRTRPMAIETGKANEQHYEVGTGVLQACLGERMKYSCCLYEDSKGKEVGGAMGDKDGGLNEAEERMLGDYVKKAGLEDGMSVLDLGYVSSFASSLFLKIPEYASMAMDILITRSSSTVVDGVPSPSTSLPVSQTAE